MKISAFADGRILIEGVSSGIPYGVSVRPDLKEAAWQEPAPVAPKSTAAPASKAEPCEGCGESVWHKIAKGGVGIGKAILGIDKIPEEAMDIRHETCEMCPAKKNRRGICIECSCVIAVKILVGGEECPLGYWRKHAD